METITNNSVVEVQFTLSNSQGEVLDQSEKGTPLTFIQGKQNLIPALENQMLDKKLGSSFEIIISSDDAYGPRRQELIQAISKDQFGADSSEIAAGMQFEVQVDQNQKLIATIVEVKENEVVLDANHPLAGENLHFNMEVLSIREATKEELDRGQVAPKPSQCGCC